MKHCSAAAEHQTAPPIKTATVENQNFLILRVLRALFQNSRHFPLSLDLSKFLIVIKRQKNRKKLKVQNKSLDGSMQPLLPGP